ncbi:GUN4 domain-containing protein [Oscillatoriales cyanobacterium LEGE 11467]|uniref:GUN4 domain-containing protein n=1 Tax=Zarconia navalis LEGE 11467 TaxID=1828826 RepID=A0A928VXL8_9CYAN|nr:GUN4 domain-containing protein [Zarconia navalis]MBE9040018.1 GUN4 domain-containing protein [Zarconia navalis LEGE 11467]
MEWISLGMAIVAIAAIARWGWMAWKRHSQQADLNIQDANSRQSLDNSEASIAVSPLAPISNIDDPKAVIEEVDEYGKLRDYLEKKKYEEADRETWRLMLQIVGARKRGYFELEDFEMFPSTALQTIDRLWIDLSEGRFGFSVQKQIYQEVETEYSQLGTRVGWVHGGKWLKMDDRTGDREFPRGHRPSAIWQSQLVSFGFFGLGMCIEVFLSRTDL